MVPYNNVISREDFDSVVSVLTGMRAVDFRIASQVWMTDKLLRYIDSGMADVPKRVGFGFANNLYLTHNNDSASPQVNATRRFAKTGMCGGIICKYNNLNIV